MRGSIGLRACAFTPVERSAVAMAGDYYHDRKALLRNLADLFHADPM
jgi:hypothetical protein